MLTSVSHFSLHGDIKYLRGELEGALKYYRTALEIRQNHLGDHIQTAASFYKVGHLSALTNDLPAAR
jgi:hypothetical protein